MTFPGEKLVIRLWETIADKGIGGFLKPWQIKREGMAHLEVRRAELLALAQTKKDVEDILGLKVIGVIPESPDVLQASNQGTPVILEDASEAGMAYDDAVRRILGETRPYRFLEPKKKGFLQRIFGG